RGIWAGAARSRNTTTPAPMISFFALMLISQIPDFAARIACYLLVASASRLPAFLEKDLGRHRGWHLLYSVVLGEDQECGVATPVELFEQSCLSLSVLRIDADVKNRFQILLDLGPAKDSPFQLGTVFAPIGIEIEGHRLAGLFMFAQGFRVTGGILVSSRPGA